MGRHQRRQQLPLLIGQLMPTQAIIHSR
jgi:hypothetical protein